MARKSFYDQMHNEISISFPPRRIVSLVPSQTELLADLGLRSEVAGITKFCIHPETWRQEKAIVGGTKNFDFRKIQELQPDLIIGNKEENYQEGIDELRRDFPVWMSDVISLTEAVDMIGKVGEITNRHTVAATLTDNIRQQFAQFANRFRESGSPRVLYLIWKNPWMGAGTDTFIGHMLDTIGWRNVLDAGTRYPELTSSAISTLDPDKILLSSEPYPFKEKHLDELRAICPRATIELVDGEMFSWYGSRLLKAPAYFASII